MHLVVCYDVVTDKRRNKLHNRLHGFLRHVQKSVFEGHLPGKRYPKLLAMIRDTVDLHTDTVRIYHMCVGCHQLTELIGTSVTVPQAPVDVVV